jgi:2,4-dienoyl-CoA reductase-like NADH-dependent reductase (Old Yellow Enzyme family)
MRVGLAPSLKRAGEFKKRLHLPIFHACRITDMATARRAVRAGLVDMIGMTRAHIADPHIVQKDDEERGRTPPALRRRDVLLMAPSLHPQSGNRPGSDTAA